MPMTAPTPPPARPDRTTAGAPPAGSTYAHSLRTPLARWWKPLVGTVGGGIVFFLVSLLLGAGAIALDTLVLGRPFEPKALSPAMYVATLLSLVVLIPIAIFCQCVLHGQATGHLGSVEGRLRRGWLTGAFFVLVPVLAVYFVGFFFLMPDQGSRAPDWPVYLAIAVLLMPVQAAAEELFFRGYVQRAVGSWFSAEKVGFVVGTLVSALLFTAAHAATDPWLLAYYFAFGVTLSALARATGGIEASIAVHAANNVVAGALAALTADPNRMFDRGVGVGGPFMLVQIAMIALIAVGLTWWARRRRLATEVA